MEKESAIASVLGWFVAILLGGLVFMWYDYLWLGSRLSYWHELMFAVLTLWLSKAEPGKWLKPIQAALFIATCVCQILAWAEVVKLPML
jgi:hypothetical protein